MQELTNRIINYLYMGDSLTILSFPEDGLPEIYKLLIEATKNPQGYDPNFAYAAISFHYLPDLSTASLETAIDSEVAIGPYPFNSLIELVQAGMEIVVIIDDWDLVSDPRLAAESADALLKKYRGRVRFIYVVEHPLMIERVKGSLPASSSTMGVVIYHKVGQDWNMEELAGIAANQYKQQLAPEQLQEISRLSNNHYEVFKRLYRDSVLNTNHAALYIESVLSDFDLDEVNTFKKLATGKPLSSKEETIRQAYTAVGFIKEDGIISIPVIADKIASYRIKGKLNIDQAGSRLTGIDLDLLTRSERRIIEHMMTTQDEISKDELADIIWGEKVNEKYSEWAIDQRMSRLRKKLRELGFDIDIKTVYGRGYQLVQLS